MIKLEIAGVHYEVDSQIKRYVRRKIGRLDRYTPRFARTPMEARVVLTQVRSQPNKPCTCEVTLRLPHETLAVRADTKHMFAAVDQAEAKLRQRLLKYKTKFSDHNFRRSRYALRAIRKFGRLPRRGRR